jgi:hypothetical protein
VADIAFPLDDGIRQALLQHKQWLRGLRWVSRAETVLLWACLLAMLALAILAMVQSSIVALCTTGAHLMLVFAVVALAKRQTCVFWLAFLLLSTINYGITYIRDLPGAELITIACCVVGVIALVAALASWFKLRKHWLGVAEYETRDDFRWILTKAPLVLRHRVVVALVLLADE